PQPIHSRRGNAPSQHTMCSSCSSATISTASLTVGAGSPGGCIGPLAVTNSDPNGTNSSPQNSSPGMNSMLWIVPDTTYVLLPTSTCAGRHASTPSTPTSSSAPATTTPSSVTSISISSTTGGAPDGPVTRKSSTPSVGIGAACTTSTAVHVSKSRH